MAKSIVMLFVALACGFPSLSQSVKTTPPLPYKECNPGPVFVSEQDSTRQRALLDSISTLFTGRWEMAVENVGACFMPAHSPARSTTLTLTAQGKGVIYVSAKQVATFQLHLSYYDGNAHFVMDKQQDAKNYFGFYPPYVSQDGQYYKPSIKGQYPNLLFVCQETLRLTGPASGLDFIFRRVKNN